MIKNLRLLRESHGISQQKLAEAVGLTQQSINKYENHKIEPDITTLIQIADFFHTSVDFLIGHSGMRRRVEAFRPYELDHREGGIVERFRDLTEKQKHCVETIIDTFREKL